MLRQLFVVLLLGMKLKLHDITIVLGNALVVTNVDLFGALTMWCDKKKKKKKWRE